MIREQFDLSKKTALVLGGRGFLGRRFCSALVEFGARVYSADLPEISHAAKHDKEVPASEGITQHTVDVTKEDSVRRLVDGIISEASKIDILIYCITAKPDDFYKPFTECTLGGWKKIMDAELDGLFLTVQQVGKNMEAARKGSIILLSSIYGIVGNDQRIYEGSNLGALYAGAKDQAGKIYSHAGYPAAKGAVISLTRYLAAYWGEHNIRVNCISPGGVAHPGENDDFVVKYSEKVPLGRKAGPEEISSATIYLASDASSYVTGHNLVVDGGWTAW